jgi:nitroimidazol reductase NimA-like FMN-containing flavoprotein (pyridoxamine 5'-phosphate oxidase superfamily)
MMGELNADEIEEVLRSEIVARIAYVHDGRAYIVPVTYVYDGECMYFHSAEGAKVRALRENPNVCVEVERIRSMANWRTVVAQGKVERLLDDAHEQTMDLLSARFAPLETSETARPSRREDVHRREGITRPLLFRIRLLLKTGRFERSDPVLADSVSP